MVWVSITGLTVRSPRHVPVFWWHAIRSMMQARRAEGIVGVEARRVGGVQHTLSVWESEEAMRRFVTTGAHLAAMRAFHRVATGSTVGYAAEVAPRGDEVHAIWLERAAPVVAR